MNDLVVLVPGITGSVLQRGDDDLWAPSSGALWQYLSSRGRALRDLVLPKHDPRSEDPTASGVAGAAPDVRADRVIDGFHGVFGLGRIDGYGRLREALDDTFDLVHGDIHKPVAANYIEFPYDWRLSNRLAGERLKALVDDRLPRWRQYAGEPDAKVILVCHSMGGLAARWWLEVEEGWRDCRALISFGTPYRGSLDALGYLANGYKRAFVDLTDVLRSCPSVYELLPIYPALKVGADYERVAEARGLPAVFDSDYLAAGLEFHREIERKVDEHLEDPKYRADRYQLHPVVGVAQNTLQSGVLSAGEITVGRELPSVVDALLDGGDGTVPQASATPIEYTGKQRELSFAERHGSLQTNDYVLEDLCARLKRMQAKGHEDVRGRFDTETRAGIALDVEPLFLKGETVSVKAALKDPNEYDQGLTVALERVTEPRESREYELERGRSLLRLGSLDPGRYRVTVTGAKRGQGAPRPISEVFEVAGDL